MYKTCPYSGEKFVPRRRNQVFATPKNRRDFHNQKASEIRQIKAPINKYLDKNVLILNKLVPPGKTRTINTSELISMGFNTNVFTHLDNFKDSVCRCIYQFIIPQSETPDTITIIHKT